MKICIDADACPVIKDTLSVARTHHVPVRIVGNTTQNLDRSIRRGDPRSPQDSKNGFYVDTLYVGVGADSADFAIIEQLESDDIVVTQDIGLAGMVLGRGARAIGVRGRIYDPITIDMDLYIRHEEKKVRRAGGRTKGPSAFTEDDRQYFVHNLTRLITTQ